MSYTISTAPYISGISTYPENLTYTPRTTPLFRFDNGPLFLHGNQTITNTMAFDQPKPSCTIQFGDEKFNLKEMRAKQEQLESENRALKLRVQKLETWFDHIRERSSIMDEFIKTVDEVIKQSVTK